MGKRPLGVTIIAGLLLLGAVFNVGQVLYIGASNPSLEEFAPELKDYPLPPEIVRGAVTAGMLLGALISLALALGLWKMKNPARIIVIVLSSLTVAALLFRTLGAAGSGNDLALLVGLIALGYNGWVIWYLAKPEVREAFAAAKAGGTVPPAETPEPPSETTPPE